MCTCVCVKVHAACMYVHVEVKGQPHVSFSRPRPAHVFETGSLARLVCTTKAEAVNMRDLPVSASPRHTTIPDLSVWVLEM